MNRLSRSMEQVDMYFDASVSDLLVQQGDRAERGVDNEPVELIEIGDNRAQAPIVSETISAHQEERFTSPDFLFPQKQTQEKIEPSGTQPLLESGVPDQADSGLNTAIRLPADENPPFLDHSTLPQLKSDVCETAPGIDPEQEVAFYGSPVFNLNISNAASAIETGPVILPAELLQLKAKRSTSPAGAEPVAELVNEDTSVSALKAYHDLPDAVSNLSFCPAALFVPHMLKDEATTGEARVHDGWHTTSPLAGAKPVAPDLTGESILFALKAALNHFRTADGNGINESRRLQDEEHTAAPVISPGFNTPIPDAALGVSLPPVASMPTCSVVDLKITAGIVLQDEWRPVGPVSSLKSTAQMLPDDPGFAASPVVLITLDRVNANENLFEALLQNTDEAAGPAPEIAPSAPIPPAEPGLAILPADVLDPNIAHGNATTETVSLQEFGSAAGLLGDLKFVVPVKPVEPDFDASPGDLIDLKAATDTAIIEETPLHEENEAVGPVVNIIPGAPILPRGQDLIAPAAALVHLAVATDKAIIEPLPLQYETNAADPVVGLMPFSPIHRPEPDLVSLPSALTHLKTVTDRAIAEEAQSYDQEELISPDVDLESTSPHLAHELEITVSPAALIHLKVATDTVGAVMAPTRDANIHAVTASSLAKACPAPADLPEPFTDLAAELRPQADKQREKEETVSVPEALDLANSNIASRTDGNTPGHEMDPTLEPGALIVPKPARAEASADPGPLQDKAGNAELTFTLNSACPVAISEADPAVGLAAAVAVRFAKEEEHTEAFRILTADDLANTAIDPLTIDPTLAHVDSPSLTSPAFSVSRANEGAPAGRFAVRDAPAGAKGAMDLNPFDPLPVHDKDAPSDPAGLLRPYTHRDDESASWEALHDSGDEVELTVGLKLPALDLLRGRDTFVDPTGWLLLKSSGRQATAGEDIVSDAAVKIGLVFRSTSANPELASANDPFVTPDAVFSLVSRSEEEETGAITFPDAVDLVSPTFSLRPAGSAPLGSASAFWHPAAAYIPNTRREVMVPGEEGPIRDSICSISLAPNMELRNIVLAGEADLLIDRDAFLPPLPELDTEMGSVEPVRSPAESGSPAFSLRVNKSTPVDDKGFYIVPTALVDAGQCEVEDPLLVEQKPKARIGAATLVLRILLSPLKVMGYLFGRGPKPFGRKVLQLLGLAMREVKFRFITI